MNLVIKGAIFDFDGVVVDSHRVHKRAWVELLKSVGRTVSEEELQFILDGRTRDDILRHFLGELTFEQLAEYGHRKEQFFLSIAADVQIVEGLLGFLENLTRADVALSIASSGSRGRVRFLLARLDLEKRFPVVITADDVHSGKPDPAVFLKAAQELRVQRSELIVFEDSCSGVTAAKAAGMACVGVAQPDRASLLLDAGADRVDPISGVSHTHNLRKYLLNDGATKR